MSAMNFISRLLLLLLLVTTSTKFLTSAMVCDKLIDTGPTGNTGASKEILETGRYEVRTIATARTNSTEVQSLIAELDGASDIQYSVAGFTAILQPKDLKKLCNSTLVRSVKQIETMDVKYQCEKLIKGSTENVVHGSYIVMIKEDVQISGIIPMITAASDDMSNSVMITGVRNFQSSNSRGAVMTMNTDGVKFMCEQSVVDYIEEDQVVSIASPTPVWHLDRIDQLDLPLDGEYSSPSNGSGVDIYIFDTGINYDHDEFEGRAIYDFYDPVDEMSGTNQQGRDCHGHGTHVAALAAGKTFGAAKGATVYSIRVLGCGGSGSFVNVILGLNHVIGEQMAQRDRKIIVSMSLRGSLSRAVDDAVRAATEEGILVVVAAGNDFTDACNFSPGASPDTITVGGTQRNDDLYLRLFDGTNYGKCVDIFAPGQDIRSAGISRRNAVATYSGTSQATPLVSGVAAIYWSANTEASPLEIKDVVLSTCTRDRLNIDGVVPPSFQGQSPNCLLYVDPHRIIDPPEMEQYKVFHSVPAAELEDLIVQMDNKSYALTFIHRHKINSTSSYSLIFKYMDSVEFKTLMLAKLGKLKSIVNDHKFDGYQLTLIYDMDSVNYIAVLQKTDIKYSEIYRLQKRKHNSAYESMSSNHVLLSTTVALTRTGSPRYSSVYIPGNETTLHWSSVTVERFLKILDRRYKKGMYLGHISTVPTDPARISVVFQTMTAPSDNYILAVDVGMDKVQEIIHAQMTTGYVPTVIAGLNTPIGLRFIIAFELLL